VRILLLACAAACALSAMPASAPAAPYMISIMQDDNQLAYSTPAQKRQALDRMKALGVDAVRVTLFWKAVAPPKRPRGFDGTNPADYPENHWDLYDELLIAARQRGIAVNLNPTGGGPRWVHRKAGIRRYQRSWRPIVGEFRKFVIAAGRRYSGHWRDENGSQSVLPRVSWWGIWNEPNQPGWLTPQGGRRPGVGMIPIAPHLYRDLLVAGAKALVRTGHRDDLVLIGELAPLGSARAKGAIPSLRPGLFLRELFCVDRRYRPFRGRRSTARGCEDVDRLGILEQFPRLAVGHHPYTKKRNPTQPEPGRDAITIANIGALPRLLDRIAARTGLLPPELPIFLTEFGYETSPPDPFSGVTLAQQAEYLNMGDYLAWRQPRVFSSAQFQLHDVPPRTEYPRGSEGYWFTYQSGLYTARPNDTPKPAANAYAFPLIATRDGAVARIWGQIRFTPNGASQRLRMQARAPGSNTWSPVGEPFTVDDNLGYFTTVRPTQPGTTWRAVWAAPDFSRIEYSREAVAR
jgi:hypothetical protein